MPVLTVESVPTDAYNGINPDVEVNEKLPGMRLLTTAALSLAPMEITSLWLDDGNASIVTCTALPALVP